MFVMAYTSLSFSVIFAVVLCIIRKKRKDAVFLLLNFFKHFSLLIFSVRSIFLAFLGSVLCCGKIVAALKTVLYYYIVDVFYVILFHSYYFCCHIRIIINATRRIVVFLNSCSHQQKRKSLQSAEANDRDRCNQLFYLLFFYC